MPIVYDPEKARTVYLPSGTAILVGGFRYRVPVTDAEREADALANCRWIRHVYGDGPSTWGRPEVPS